VGIGRGPENAALAKKLGAHTYIDSKATNPAEALQKDGRCESDSGNGAECEGDVGCDRRIGRLAGNYWWWARRLSRWRFSVVQLLMARRGDSGMAFGDGDGFAGDAGIFGVLGRAADGGKSFRWRR